MVATASHFKRKFTLIELLVNAACQFVVSATIRRRPKGVPGQNGNKRIPLFFERERGRGGKGKLSFPVKRKFSLSTAHSFTLIELLVVIAIIAILSRSKNSFFLPFSAI